MTNSPVLNEINREKLKEVLANGYPMSKAALAEMTGLDLPLVIRLVDELVKTREIQAVGTQSAGKGKSCRVYQYNPDCRSVIGLILQGQTLDWFLLDSLGMTKNQGQIEVESDRQETMRLLLQTMRRCEPSLCCFALGVDFEADDDLLKELEMASGLKGIIGSRMHFSAEGSGQRLRLKENNSLISFGFGQSGLSYSFVMNGKAQKDRLSRADEADSLPELHEENPSAELLQAQLQWIVNRVLAAEPDIVVFYAHPFFEQHRGEILAGLKRGYNTMPVPEVMIADTFQLDYEIGISRQAMALLEEFKDRQV
ncbi:ROK family protein [Holdemania massiliensis]|uniref:ROK family protein n=1 Tax=Holdemania massiliensis TaxID=1468449 RepID=UPI00242DB8DC|nr:ROK family protein [Holdemania massiliensis]